MITSISIIKISSQINPVIVLGETRMSKFNSSVGRFIEGPMNITIDIALYGSNRNEFLQTYRDAEKTENAVIGIEHEVEVEVEPEGGQTSQVARQHQQMPVSSYCYCSSIGNL
jgi:hypothetical protein